MPLTVTTVADNGAGPEDFDILVPFTTPFFYTPGLNLLLEWRVNELATFPGFFTTSSFLVESVNELGDSVSIIYGPGDSFNPLSMNKWDSYDLVTRFDGTLVQGEPIPEPASLLLLGVGLLGLGRSVTACASRPLIPRVGR